MKLNKQTSGIGRYMKKLKSDTEWDDKASDIAREIDEWEDRQESKNTTRRPPRTGKGRK